MRACLRACFCFVAASLCFVVVLNSGAVCLCCPDTQLWPRTVLRKWLNIRSPESDFSADEGGTTGDDTDSEVEYEGG